MGELSLNLQFSCHCVANFVTPQLYSTLVKLCVLVIVICSFVYIHQHFHGPASYLTAFISFGPLLPSFVYICSSFMASRACYLLPAIKLYVHRSWETVLV